MVKSLEIAATNSVTESGFVWIIRVWSDSMWEIAIVSQVGKKFLELKDSQ